jgi:excinuclease ABC subunit C
VTENEKFDPGIFLRNLTSRPGVYRMLNDKGKVVYVGKAQNLKKRVASYFQRPSGDAKTASLMSVVRNVEVTVTATEAEALLLEYNLIKQYKPKFNVTLRDDKSYPYIFVSTGHTFPRLEFHRGPRKGSGKYFGPYPSTSAVRKTLNELQKLFMIRQCQDSYFSNRTRPCLQYQIRRCTAPCVGYIDAASYAEDIEAAMQFLEGRNRKVTNTLVERMEQASVSQDYERAARFRDQIARIRQIEAEQHVSNSAAKDLDVLAIASEHGVHCVTVLFIRQGAVLGSRDHFPKIGLEATPKEVLEGFLPQYYLGRQAPAEIILPTDVDDRKLFESEFTERSGRQVGIRHKVRGDRQRWLQMAATNAGQGLRLKLASNANLRRQFEALGDILQCDAAPQRIECFDVSHTAGEATVASCVVFNEAGSVKSDYRRFNLKPDIAGDDYAAMAEAIRRRFVRVAKGEVATPDLVLIDGGRGQLAEAMTVLDELGLEGIQLVAIAKGPTRKPGMEQLFLAGQSRPTILPPDSPALHLIQQIRDEAHRFAITGHRGRRARARNTSSLEEISGLGPKKRRELLRQFGGLQGIKAAGVDDLVKVHGISRSLAERIYNDLHADVGG